MVKGAAARYPNYTTAKAERRRNGLRPQRDQLRDGRRRPGRDRPECRPAATGSGSARSARTAHSAAPTRRASRPTASATACCRPSPSPPTPAPSTPPGSADKPNVGIGFSAGTGGGYGPEGVNGSRVFLPFGLDPARTPVMGSYDENTAAAKATSAWYELPPRTPDRPLVTVAAAGAIWSIDDEGDFNYGQSLKLQWGVAQSGRQLPRARRGRADRPAGAAAGVAQPALPAGVGATGGQRRPHRRRRPEPVHRPVVRVHPAARPGPGDRATVPRVDDAGADGHRHRRELPVPATGVRSTSASPSCRTTESCPTPSRSWCRPTSGSPPTTADPSSSSRRCCARRRSRRTCSGDWYRDWGSIERYDRIVPAADRSRRHRRPGRRDGSRLDAPRTRSEPCHWRRTTREDYPLGGDDRGADRLRAVGADPAAAGGADHRDGELAAGRTGRQRHRAAHHADAGHLDGHRAV